MTLDDVLTNAQGISDTHDDWVAVRFARGVLGLLIASQPCGWEPLAVDLPNQTIELGELELSPDEARWIATELLRGADACEAHRALTSNQTDGKSEP